MWKWARKRDADSQTDSRSDTTSARRRRSVVRICGLIWTQYFRIRVTPATIHSLCPALQPPSMLRLLYGPDHQHDMRQFLVSRLQFEQNTLIHFRTSEVTWLYGDIFLIKVLTLTLNNVMHCKLIFTDNFLIICPIAIAYSYSYGTDNQEVVGEN